MIFSFSVETPPSTTAIAPLKTILPIAKGVIHRWQIFFPPGPWGELRMCIKKGSEPILPINPEAFLSGDNFTFMGDEFKYISSEPYNLNLYTWNLDTIYAHSVYIYLFMKPLWTFTPYSPEMLRIIEEAELAKVL